MWCICLGSCLFTCQCPFASDRVVCVLWGRVFSRVNVLLPLVVWCAVVSFASNVVVWCVCCAKVAKAKVFVDSAKLTPEAQRHLQAADVEVHHQRDFHCCYQVIVLQVFSINHQTPPHIRSPNQFSSPIMLCVISVFCRFLAMTPSSRTCRPSPRRDTRYPPETHIQT